MAASALSAGIPCFRRKQGRRGRTPDGLPFAKILYTPPADLLRGYEQICVQFVNSPRRIVAFGKAVSGIFKSKRQTAQKTPAIFVQNAGVFVDSFPAHSWSVLMRCFIWMLMAYRAPASSRWSRKSRIIRLSPRAMSCICWRLGEICMISSTALLMIG